MLRLSPKHLGLTMLVVMTLSSIALSSCDLPGLASSVPGYVPPPPTAAFPTSASTGVTPGVALKNWTGAYRTSSTPTPTESINGATYKVFDGYLVDTRTSGAFLMVDDPYVIFRNTRFVTSGQVSNTGAMVQTQWPNRALIIATSEFDGGPYFQRGMQSDTSDLYVGQSRFHNTGEAGIEKNDRSGGSSLVVTDSYLTNDKGWPRSQHVDGIEVGGAKDVTIRHNTVLVQPFGGAEGDTSYVSNSALGLWAEPGYIVSGTVTVDNNLLAGGGRTIYVENLSPGYWQGPVNIVNNVFDTRFGPNAAVWGPLYPNRIPANLTWSGNVFSDGRSLTLTAALSNYP